MADMTNDSRVVRDIYFDTKEDREDILCQMNTILKKYGFVSVADYYDLVGFKPTYLDAGYGWANLDNVMLCKNDEYGYKIVLPKPCRIDDVEGVSYNGRVKSKSTRYISSDASSCTPDMVNHPPHYKSETGLEAIDVIEAFTFDLKGIEATDTGNILKYMCRWKQKNGLQDLKKAMWYLQHLIDHVEKLEKENG